MQNKNKIKTNTLHDEKNAKEIRWRHIFVHEDGTPGEYTPELHINSKLGPDLASNGTENAAYRLV